MTTRTLNGLYAAIAVVILAGCSSSGGRAPIMERGVNEPKEQVAISEHARADKEDHTLLRPAGDWRPMTYVVQKGDTLYSIAFNYGLDYHDVAELNNIEDPNVIKVGQEIRLFSGEAPPESATVAAPVEEAGKPAVEAIPLKERPRAVKLSYSKESIAEIRKMQEASAEPEAVAAAKPEPRPVPKPEPKPEPVHETGKAAMAAEGEVDWSMPADGKMVAGFSESANRKGIDIAGKLGQPVKASAPGKVVYSGSGLRGYGKLVIIKHNSTYLSAYAHNNTILVKEGEMVSKGQKIAEMGNTDASRVALHFEIRKLGKPVDPAKYLSLK